MFGALTSYQSLREKGSTTFFLPPFLPPLERPLFLPTAIFRVQSGKRSNHVDDSLSKERKLKNLSTE
ncbi:hypothetical protein DOY81_007189, partial [Sarcophaga bullata]